MKFQRHSLVLACASIMLLCLFSVSNSYSEEETEEVKKTVLEITFSQPSQISILQGRIGYIDLAKQAELLEALKPQVEKAVAETEKQLQLIQTELVKYTKDVDNNTKKVENLLERRITLKTQLEDLKGKNNDKLDSIVKQIEAKTKEYAAFNGAKRKKMVEYRLKNYFGDESKFKVNVIMSNLDREKEPEGDEGDEGDSIINATLFTDDKAVIADVCKLLQTSAEITGKFMNKDSVSVFKRKWSLFDGHRIYFSEKYNKVNYFEEPSAFMFSGNIRSAKVTGGDFINIDIVLSMEAGEKFATLTSANINRSLGVFIGRRCITNPVIRGAITGGKLSISGGFSKKECEFFKAFFLNKPIPASVITRVLVLKKVRLK